MFTRVRSIFISARYSQVSSRTTCTQGDWINLTHVYGCNPGPLGAPAHVHPDQHGIAFMVAGGTSPGYFAHDGGISRTLDGYAGLNSGSCSGTNQFDSLSQTLGSMTEFVAFSLDPTDADILLGGTQGNGSPKTSTATENSTWQNALGGDGGFNAINPANPSEWFAANPYVTILECDSVTGTDRIVTTVHLSKLSGRAIWAEIRELTLLPIFWIRRMPVKCSREPAGCGRSAPADPLLCN
jgi:hypothetical protein